MCTYWYLLQFIHFQIMWFNNPPFQIWKYDGINYDFSGTWFPIFLCDSISWSNGRNQYFTKFNTKKPYSEFINIEYLVQGHIIQPFTGSDGCFTIFLTDQKKPCLFISLRLFAVVFIENTRLHGVWRFLKIKSIWLVLLFSSSYLENSLCEFSKTFLKCIQVMIPLAQLSFLSILWSFSI